MEQKSKFALRPLIPLIGMWVALFLFSDFAYGQGGCTQGCVVNYLSITSGQGSNYDPIWRVDGHPAFVINQPNGAWGLGGGGWISNTSGTYYWPNGVFHYQTCFCVCDTDSVTLNFSYMVDDIASIYLDGTFITSGGSYSSPTSVNQTLYLLPGKHCLNIDVYNTQHVSTGLNILGGIQGNYILSKTCCETKGSICGIKYHDLDHNGTMGSMDTAISGWKFYLFDHNGNLIDSAVTDSYGNYCFLDIDPDLYYVYEENRSGWSHIYPEDHHTANVTSGTVYSGDFGNYKGVRSNRVCGIKYHDVNCNGVRDSLPTLEPGIEWWTINIYDSASQQTVSVYTDSLGRFCSELFFDGTYTISEEDAAHWHQSEPDTPFTYTFHMDGNDSVYTVFGNCQDTAGRICGFKWDDVNRDGVKQSNEPRIAGWTIYLSGPVTKTAVTDANGEYCFEKLGPGTYTVSEYQSPVWQQIYPNAPGTYTVVLSFNDEVYNRNFGNSLGRGLGYGNGSGCFPDTLKLNTGYDHNSKTTYGTEEYDAFWQVVNSPVTGTTLPTPAITLNESYSTSGWNSVLPGSRWISLHPTSELALSNQLTDKPYSYQTCFCNALNDSVRFLMDIMVDDLMDVYLDNVKIGSYHAGGYFTPGTAIHIDTTIFVTRNYHCLRMDVWNVAGILHGLDVSGAAIGAGVMAHNCCMTQSSLCGVKFADDDQNGQRNLASGGYGEKVLKNWKIYLKDANGNVLDSTLTDTIGQYCFRNLPLGSYHVEEESRISWRKITPYQDYVSAYLDTNEVDIATFGNFYDTTCFIHDTLHINSGYDYSNNQLDTIGQLDNAWTIESSPGGYPKHSAISSVNNAAWKPAMSNSQWLTFDGNSVHAQTNGWYMFQRCFCLKNDFDSIKLVLRLRVDDSARVFVNGTYVGGIGGNFNALNPYTLTITNRALFHNGENCIQINVRNTGGPSGLNVSGEVITDPNTSAQTCCGIARKGSISGWKWNDLNGDGIQQSNEPRLAGWPIGIYGGQWVYTDANGYYIIPNLDANYYTIIEGDSLNWHQKSPYDDGLSPFSGSYDVDVEPGLHVPFINFGNFFDPENSSISGFKWEDQNQDGIWQPTEPKLSNWKIVLSNGDTILTDIAGNYIFSNLPSGTYTVSEVQQYGWGQSFPFGGTHTVVLGVSQATAGINFGNYHRCFKQKSVALAGAGANTAWQIVQDPDPTTIEPRSSTIVSPVPGTWRPAIAGSNWLSVASNAMVTLTGTYTFQRCFCLKAGAQLPTLSLQLRADLFASVYLNGNLIGSTPNPGYNTLTPTTITTSNPAFFVPGQNCIKIVVTKNLPGTMGMNVSGTITTLDSTLANQCCGLLSSGGGGEKIIPSYIYDPNPIQAEADLHAAGAEPATGLKEADADGRFTFALIPNPTSAVFHIRCDYPFSSYDKVDVVDMMGRKVLSSERVPVNHVFDMSQRPRGTYMVIVNTGGRISTLKLSLQ